MGEGETAKMEIEGCELCVRVWTVVVEMRQAQDDRRCCSEGDCYGFWAAAATAAAASSR
jgi:hypothetical protein